MSNFKMKGSQFYGTKCMCNSDSPLKSDKTVTVGENTSELNTDKKGNKYALILEDSKNFAKNDTIRPGNARIKNNYIIGGDYKTKKTGNKNYVITGDVPPKK